MRCRRPDRADWLSSLSAAVGAERELELVQRLAETDSPVAALEPRVEPRVFVRDGFEIAMWTYFEPVQSRELPPADYAHALERLHAGMRQVDVATPHFMDRVADVQRWVARRDVTPDLAGEDRELLADTLGSLRRSIVDRGAAEQLLHGEPHPWNVLNTKNGPLFVDFENCVSGPVEYDLGWVPKAVSERYPGADQDLVGECRGLVLAMVAAHGWRRGDHSPAGNQEWRSSTSCGRVRPGPRSIPCSAQPTPCRDGVRRRLRRHRVAEGVTVGVVADEAGINHVRRLRRQGRDAARGADRGSPLVHVLPLAHRLSLAGCAPRERLGQVPT